MKSPDGQYELRIFEKSEYRMGSPQYGRVDILNSPCTTDDHRLGEVVAFSPDSRFLAIDELVSWRDYPHTRAVVFELATGKDYVAHEQSPGIITDLTWVAANSLSITAYISDLGEERQHTWSAPS